MGVKGFLKKPLATGNLVMTMRKVIDEEKGSTQEFVIQSTIDGFVKSLLI
jgi:hypothetical protein